MKFEEMMAVAREAQGRARMWITQSWRNVPKRSNTERKGRRKKRRRAGHAGLSGGEQFGVPLAAQKCQLSRQRNGEMEREEAEACS